MDGRRTPELYRKALQRAVDDPFQTLARLTAARRLAAALDKIGKHAFVYGHIVGPDRRDGASPFGHGDDAVVAASRLASIAGQLTSGAADLISDGRAYAGSALLRQLVEVEYLARLFSEDFERAAQWLRSDKQTRMNFFSPRKLRELSDGFFRDGDWTWHCEMGGHPVPNSGALIENRNNLGQILLSDAVGHAGRIAGYILAFLSGQNALLPTEPIDTEISEAIDEWQQKDKLTQLAPPPSWSSSGEGALR